MKKAIIPILLILVFLTWIFYPVIFYKEDFNNLPGRILIYDRNSKIITDKSKENGYFKTIELNKSDNKFITSLLEIEDKTFYGNYGVSVLSKLRALKDNLGSGRIVSGGSTITEQYIKNKYFLGKNRTILQKIREAGLAVYFSIFYDKEYLLNEYLDNVYFGNNIYGVGAAIEVYFGKDKLEDLSDEEITLLISLIHYPSIGSLNENTFSLYFQRIKERLGFKFEEEIIKLKRKDNINKNPFITNKIIENINKKEIIVKTTVDYDLSKFGKEVLNKTLEELKDKNVTNGAIFAINPSTMEVLIYEGSRDFYSSAVDGQVDVIRSKRQMGSTIKPFLYLQALELGANPDDLLVDLESEYDSFKDSSIYMSENYSLKEYGIVRFKKALGNSLNNATVRLAKEIGLHEVFNFYKKYGFKLDFEAEHYGYSLVLGNPDISLENLVLSYINLIPNFKLDNGREPVFVKDNTNNVNNTNIDKNKFLLYDILKDPDNRDVSFGVNSILNTSIMQAVKTGTSSDFRDNLIISYNPDFIIGIWIGNNDNSSMIGVTGITGAGYVWHQIIEKAISYGYIKNMSYKIPNGIEETEYCLDENCFRREINYKKNGKVYFSRILDNFYDKKDLFEKLLFDETSRLDNLQIYLN